MIVLIMGVEGAGKSTIGRALAKELGWEFSEGDDFHSIANKEKMSKGIALTDADRAPWIAALHAEIAKWHKQGTNGVLAASVLRDVYRSQLFADIPTSEYRIVYLHGLPALLAQRVRGRVGHFAARSMLDSQLATLEPPRNTIAVSIDQSVIQQVAEIRSALGV